LRRDQLRQLSRVEDGGSELEGLLGSGIPDEQAKQRSSHERTLRVIRGGALEEQPMPAN
jgi:hypothetical protein